MIRPLTSLRFFAAASVVIYHIGFPSVVGELGITFFFVLSGFIISNQYENRLSTASAIGHFYASRAARIFPMHLACMALSVPIMLYEGLSYSPLHTVATALLLNSWFPGDSFTYNYVAWTLSVELFFYLLTPAILAALRCTGISRSATSCFALSFVSGAILWTLKARLYPLMHNDIHSTWWWVLFVSPYFYIFSYLAGIGAGLGFSRVKKIDLSFSAWTSLEIAVLTLSALGLMLLRHEQMKREPMVWAFAAIIFVFAFSGGAISRALSVRPMVLLGEISFSLYMLHQLLMRAVDDHIVWITYPSAQWYEQIAFVAILIVASWIGFRFIEDPTRLAIRAILGKGTSSGVNMRLTPD